MKRIGKFLLLVTVISLALVGVVHLTRHVSTEYVTRYARDCEKVCYGLCGLSITLLFTWSVGRVKRLWMQVFAAVATSVVFTSLVFLLNNFWRYVSILHLDGGECPFSLFDVMKWDITYTYHYGALRYPILFFSMLAVCGMILVLSHPRTQRWFRALWDKVERWLFVMHLKRQSLADMYYLYAEEGDICSLMDYVGCMPLDESHKAEGLAFVNAQGDLVLLYMLVKRYADILTREEYVMCRNLFLTTIRERWMTKVSNEIALPDIFQQLDEKFGFSESEQPS